MTDTERMDWMFALAGALTEHDRNDTGIDWSTLRVQVEDGGMYRGRRLMYLCVLADRLPPYPVYAHPQDGIEYEQYHSSWMMPVFSDVIPAIPETPVPETGLETP